MKVKSYLRKLFAHLPAGEGRSSLIAQDGFTLIEIVMIIVVISIAIPTLLIVLGQGARQSVDAELQVSATNVAQAMMEEIKSKCWDETAASAANCSGAVSYSTLGYDPASVPAEVLNNLTTYDDVDDYSSGVPAVSVGGVSYSRSVQVCYVPSTNLNSITPCVTAGASGTDYKRIQVTVTNATLGSVNLVTVVTNY